MSRFKRFEIGPLLAEHNALILDAQQGVLSLLSVDGKQTISEQQLLTPSEMPVIDALLGSYPDYCPYEVVLWAMTGKSLEKCRERVLWGLEEGEVDVVMRPVRNLLGRARLKLRPFGIDIRSMIQTGYMLTPLRQRIRERV
jgi:hypothetical protein